MSFDFDLTRDELLRNLLALGISYVFVGLILAVMSFLHHKGKISGEAARKSVHISMSNWFFLVVFLFNNIYFAALPPLTFIIVNFVSYRRNIFKAVERQEGERSPGTVYYAVSLFTVTVAASLLERVFSGALYVGLIAVLAMGYGDGFAGVVGKRFGKRKFPPPFPETSLLGSLTFFGITFILTFTIYGVWQHFSGGFTLINTLYLSLLCAGAGMAFELFGMRGLDNLFVPIGVFILAAAFFLAPTQAALFGCVGLTAFICTLSAGLRLLNYPGAAAAFVTGALLHFAGGWLFYAELILFFVLGSGISLLGRKRKAEAKKLHNESGERRGRTLYQVLANSLAALISAVVYRFTGNLIFKAGFYAAMCFALADTFASEIGSLSKSEPVTIWGFKPIARGLSGGITVLGIAASLLGALLMCALPAADPEMRGLPLLLIFAAGFLGALFDSLMGALVQAKYFTADGTLTEKTSEDGAALTLARGVRWIDNNAVNLIGGVFSAAVGILLGLIIV